MSSPFPIIPPQGPAQNYICKRYLINIYPGKDRSKPGSLWTYLGDRPRLPRVVAMSQHSEKTAPLWTSSSNLGGERCYMRSFPHCSLASLPRSAPTSAPYPLFGTAMPLEEEDAWWKREAKPSSQVPFPLSGGQLICQQPAHHLWNHTDLSCISRRRRRERSNKRWTRRLKPAAGRQGQAISTHRGLPFPGLVSEQSG